MGTIHLKKSVHYIINSGIWGEWVEVRIEWVECESDGDNTAKCHVRSLASII